MEFAEWFFEFCREIGFPAACTLGLGIAGYRCLTRVCDSVNALTVKVAELLTAITATGKFEGGNKNE